MARCIAEHTERQFMGVCGIVGVLLAPFGCLQWRHKSFTLIGELSYSYFTGP